MGNYKKSVLYNGFHYDVTDFVKIHPGGKEIIEFYAETGDDATLPIQQFHHRSISRVHGVMRSLRRCPATSVQVTVDSEVTRRNQALTADFLKLFLDLKKEGLFEPCYTHVTYRMVEMMTLGLVGLYLMSFPTNIFLIIPATFVLSMAQGRAIWIMHESGHYSWTGKPKLDKIIQSFAIGASVGLSATWWRRHHNKHHAMLSRIKYDVDLDIGIPLMVYNIDVLDDPKRDQNVFLRYQKYFLIIYGLIGILHWQLWEAIRSLCDHKSTAEIISISLHYYLVFSHMDFWPWLITTWMTGLYMFGNFGLSHSFLPVTSEGTHWMEQAFLYTADIEQRPWCNWWMGYLNYQIEHHLFPTMPQFRHPLIVDRVKALATKYGLPYYLFSYRDAVSKTINNIGNVADQLKQLHNHQP